MTLAMYKSDYRRQPFTYHPEIGWWHLPNFYARLPLGRTYHNFQTNSLGMRDRREHSRQAGARRLVFLGDSYTAGDGVDNEQRFSDGVRSRMYSPVETLNFALNASGTDQQLIIFEQMAKHFEASGYVWGICVENIVRNLCNCRPSWDFAEHHVIYRPKPCFTLSGGVLHQPTVPVPKTIIDSNMMESSEWVAFPKQYVTTGSIYDLYGDRNAYPWQLMKTLIQRMIAQAGGKPVFLMPLPMVDHYLHHLPAYYLERFAELHAPEHNVFVVDILPAFLDKPESLRRAFRFPDDPHYTISAHMLAADVLACAIQRYAPQLFYQDAAT